MGLGGWFPTPECECISRSDIEDLTSTVSTQPTQIVENQMWSYRDLEPRIDSLSYRAAFDDRRGGLNPAPIPTAGKYYPGPLFVALAITG
jgi:hypothetical protein